MGAEYLSKNTFKLKGYIVRPKIYLLIYVTWDDDVTSRGKYIMMSKQPQSWIRHIGFQNFPIRQKTAQITEKFSKSIKQCKKKKNLKGVKISESKLIFTNGNTKITNLEKYVCENDVTKVTTSSKHNNLSYQFISR